MGLDLTLHPNRWRSENPLLLYGLRLDRNYDLFDAIREKNMVPIPSACLYPDDDKGLVETVTDPYGAPLMQVWAGVLAAIPAEVWGSSWNKAAHAFLQHIPPDAPIILYWS